jgi:dipeptidyl aminopeptidase/acylaminoacyl peptidase
MSVLLVDVDTGQARKLGSLPLTEATCCPESVRWSADRRHVFLSSVLGLQAVVDVGAGTVEAAGAAPPGQFVATISRRGDRIARVDQVSGRTETIVISDLAGREVRRLSVPGGRHVEELAWSPDDGSLAVLGSAGSDGDPDTLVTYLSVVPVDGSPARDLADNAAEVAAAPALPPRATRMSGYVGAAWSPDGKTIALADRACDSDRGRRIVNGVEIAETYTCAGRLLLFDVASGEPTVLMRDEGVPGPPSWSPDGTRLAFGQFAREGELRDLPNCHPCDAPGLFVIDRDGDGLTRLADGDGPASWSPDGTRLVFPRFDWELPEGAFRSEMWVVPADGGLAKLIAQPAAAGW